MQLVLKPWRRHSKDCPHAAEGRSWIKCTCPIWCDGEVNGQRVRLSLDTRSWGRAARKMADLEQRIEDGKQSKPFPEACDAFLSQAKIAEATGTKYRRWVKFLKVFAEAHGLVYVSDWTLTDLDAYRASRQYVCELSWSKELQFLRQIFKWFGKRKWIEGNPAGEMDMPKDPKPLEVLPYTKEEMAAILRACDDFGRHPYERLRSKAIVLLQRHYGFRISDVSTLRRDRITNGQIAVRAQKNGATIWAPIYPAVQEALDRLPIPRKGGQDCPYFFWGGPESSTAINFVKTVERTMRAVFDRSGVAKAHTHRFRHTLATEILVSGGSYEDVAEILGDDRETVKKHYAKWNRAYQERITTILNKVHLGTEEPAKEKTTAGTMPLAPLGHINSFNTLDGVDLVAKVGVEPADKTKKQ